MDTRTKVNLTIFGVSMTAWVALGIAMAIPGYELPTELKNLFSGFTLLMIRELTGFATKKITTPSTANHTEVTE